MTLDEPFDYDLSSWKEDPKYQCRWEFVSSGPQKILESNGNKYISADSGATKWWGGSFKTKESFNADSSLGTTVEFDLDTNDYWNGSTARMAHFL